MTACGHLRSWMSPPATISRTGSPGISNVLERLQQGWQKTDIASSTRRHLLQFFANDEAQKFNSAFFVICFTAYSFPMITAWRMASDVNVTFWFGRFPFWCTVPVPLIFIVVYILQTRNGRPKRPFLLLSIIVPSVIFFLVGVSLKFKAKRLQDQLQSVDCSVIPKLRHVYHAAEDARRLYAECNPTNERMIIQTCPKYGDWLDEDKDRKKTWMYLEYLEENSGCSGFCIAGNRPLWHFKEDAEVRDACAPCVAAVLGAKVVHSGEQLMFYSVSFLLAFLLWMFLMGPTLRKIGSVKHMRRRESLLGRLAQVPPEGKPQPRPVAYASAPPVLLAPRTVAAMPVRPVLLPPPPAKMPPTAGGGHWGM